MTAQPLDDLLPRVEDAVLRRVGANADLWFPGVGGDPTVRLRRLVTRPRAVLYAVHVGDGAGPPQLLAKVRRDWPSAGAQPRAGARPRLATSLLSAAELTALEYAGLRGIQEMLGDDDPAFRAVRPLDHLVAEDTILMEYVDAETLSERFRGESRLSPRGALSRRRAGDGHWRRAGAWLRRYQQHMPADGLPARQATRAEVVEQFSALDEFLTARLGRRAVGDVARRGAELAADVLPAQLALAVGHGDYAPRNVFVLGDGRLAVFDPTPRWAVPRVEDLCRFLVAIRLPGLQVHARGAAYGRRDLDRRERAVIEGYRAEGVLPLPELRAYQLLITLDKWSALVDAPSGGWRRRLTTGSVELASGHLRREAARLLALGGAERD